MTRILLGLAALALLAGCASTPSNVETPPFEQRPKEAKTVIPPLNSGQK